MSIERSIKINADIQTSLSGMDKVRRELSQAFEKQKLDLGADTGLSKLIKEYDEARRELDSLISKGHITPEESKKTKQLTKEVGRLYDNIMQSLEKIGEMELPDLKKLFPSNFSARAATGLKKIAKYYSALGTQQIKLNKLEVANTELTNLNSTLTALQNKRTKVDVEADISQASKAIEALEKKKRDLESKVYNAFAPKEQRDAQGRTQREADELAVKAAEDHYEKMIQAERAINKSKPRILNQNDQKDLDDLQKQYNQDLSSVQIEKAQAKQIRDKLSQEIARRTGAQGKRGKGYELVSDTDIQNQYANALKNYEGLKEKEAQIKNKYAQDKKTIRNRPQNELKQDKARAKSNVELAKNALDTAKKVQKTNRETLQEEEEIAKQKAKNFIEGKDKTGIPAEDISDLEEYNRQIQEQIDLQEKLNKEKAESFKDKESKDSSIAAQELKISKKKNEILELEDAISKLKESTDINTVFKELKELGINTDGIEETEEGLRQIKETLSSMNTDVAKKIKSALEDIGETANRSSEDIKKLKDGFNFLISEEEAIKQQEADIKNLQESFLQFFSIGNSIELFKRAVRASIETVKELDAVMTETAVVTDFTVGDMWEKLPQYAKQASKLGTSIKDLYSATTLYYQQGLNSEQAMSVGIETMKMARVANMEASDATTAMTAALRGFNMELNEISATRVNDVYSELAAITAADTSQIATAMSKTASIAASANMEFETTAALLAQIIETTQEAPETAGTAMKTIIARFTEVKELFSEGTLTGKDEEGEEISINKIDAALKTVGISLKDFLNGSKGIDDIFLELASKWDSLDLATQRYIATAAAGSRQQSRFIAMMSNYERTMELVTAANNSAGASQKQYEKTLESMEAKLQKLENAWDTFIMNLSNQDVLKGGIDSLTKLLEVVNNLTQAFSGGNGLSKTLLSFATAFGALKLGKSAINFVSTKLFDGKKFIPDMKSLEELTNGKLNSVFKGLERGIKAKSFKEIFGEADNLEKIKMDLTGVSTAAMGTGVAINLLGSIFNAIGWEDLGEGVATFGSNVTALGGAAAVAAPLLQSLDITVKTLGIGIGVLSTIFTLLPYIFKAVKAATPEGKLETAQEATLRAGEAAESAANSYEILKNALDGIDDKYDSLDRMVYGTQQWKESAHELNEEILNLIDKYPELNKYFEYNDGVLTKKKGADQEIDRLLREDTLNVQRVKQVQTQSRINEQTAGRSILSSYDLDQAFQWMNGQGTVMGSMAQNLAAKYGKSLANEELTEQEVEDQLLGEGIALSISFEKLRSYGELLNIDQNRYDAQIANNIKAQAQLSGLSTQQTENLDSNLIANIRERIYTEELENLGTLTADDKDAYAKLYGYRRAGDKYFTAEGTEVQNVTDEAIKVALASSRADEAAIAQIVSLTLGMAEGSAASRLLSDDGMNLTSNDVDQLKGDLSKENINKVFGVDIEELAKKSGANTEAEIEAFYENIKQSIVSANDRIETQRINLIASMNKYSKLTQKNSEKTLFDLNAITLKQLEDTYGEGFRDTLDNIFMALQRSSNEAITEAGYGNFITKAVQQGTSPADLEKLSGFITEVDWSNPIKAAYQLNQEIKKASGITEEFAQNMLAVQQGYLGTASQLRYFIQSSDFEGVQEDLNEILQTSNEIGAADVLKLADSYDSLNKLLKNTETSAAGVAKALELIAKGEIEIDQLTDATLASLKNFDGLNSMIAELQKKLEDFEPGIDENFASDFIAQASEVVKTNLKKGAVGNNQIDKYFDLLFTDDWDEGYIGENRIARIKELSKILNNNSENLASFWDTIATDATWQKNLSNLGDFGVSRNAEGEIILSGYEGMSTQDQINALVEASKNTSVEISEAMAEMLLTDFKNYSYDYEYLTSTKEQDALLMAQEVLETLATIGDQTLIDQNQIDTIETVMGQNIYEPLKQLVEQNKGRLTITEFYEEDGSLKSGDNLISEMAQAQGYEKIDEYKQEKFGYKKEDTTYVHSSNSYLLGKAKLDMAQIEQQLTELKLPQESKTQIAQDVIDSFFAIEGNKDATFELDFQASDGSMQTLALKAGDSVEAEMANRELEIKNTFLAESMSNYFANNPLHVTIDPNTEDLEGKNVEVTADMKPNMQAVDEALKNLTATVRLIPSIVGYADGIKNSPTTHDALVGEEGAELIERQDGTAYLSGLNGPEVTTIYAGDTVHTAEETKKILRGNKGISIPRFEDGAHGYKNVKRGGNGEDRWENSFDKLYNLVRKIDEELHQRERVERRYEKLLESIDTSTNKIIAVSREELTQLEKERMLQEQLIARRKKQISSYQSEKAELTKYANVVQNDRGEDVLRINWDLINSVTDTDKGERIEKYVSQLEEWIDDLEAAEEALWDIEDAVEEIKERGEEEYFDLEDAIKEALVQSYQNEIDKLSEINDSINDTNSSLLDAIQKSVDKQRRDRDNQRTEEDLTEKQRRLLYLQQDTSGANAMEILQLQKEIEEGQEDYTDSLIDQKISELQEQNDDAAKQREQQITLLQAQLDHYIKTGQVWQDVYSLIDEGLDKDSGLVRGSRLEELLKTADGFAGMSEISKMEWLNDTNNMIAQALAYLEVGRQIEDIGLEAGTTIQFTDIKGNVLSGTADEKGNVTTSNGQSYNNVFQGADGKYYAGENIEEPKEVEVETPKTTKTESSTKSSTETDNPPKVTPYWTITGSSEKYATEQEAKFALQKLYTQIDTSANYQTVTGRVDTASIKKKYQVKYHGYKTGGLADYTGPAWLDGTKSRPEIVLNQQDSRNFVQLRDILSSVLSRGNVHTATENNGDILYDIDINVESIGSDYDVEQVANKVKSLINEDARYRNNNTVSLKR